jgi:hypothetical protein
VSATGTGITNQIETAIATLRQVARDGDLANVLGSETLPRVRELIAKVEEVGRECAGCDGTGKLTLPMGNEEAGAPCPDCDDLRALLSRVRQ